MYRIHGTVMGLSPGLHGFHIHAEVCATLYTALFMSTVLHCQCALYTVLPCTLYYTAYFIGRPWGLVQGSWGTFQPYGSGPWCSGRWGGWERPSTGHSQVQQKLSCLLLFSNCPVAEMSRRGTWETWATSRRTITVWLTSRLKTGWQRWGQDGGKVKGECLLSFLIKHNWHLTNWICPNYWIYPPAARTQLLERPLWFTLVGTKQIKENILWK